MGLKINEPLARKGPAAGMIKAQLYTNMTTWKQGHLLGLVTCIVTWESLPGLILCFLCVEVHNTF